MDWAAIIFSKIVVWYFVSLGQNRTDVCSVNIVKIIDTASMVRVWAVLMVLEEELSVYLSIQFCISSLRRAQQILEAGRPTIVKWASIITIEKRIIFHWADHEPID